MHFCLLKLNVKLLIKLPTSQKMSTAHLLLATVAIDRRRWMVLLVSLIRNELQTGIRRRVPLQTDRYLQ